MWKLNFSPRTNAAPAPDAASVFFERMEPKILFSADALSGVVSMDPFGDNDSANAGLNVNQSAGFLNEVYAPAANETDYPPVTTQTEPLQLDALQAALDGNDAANDPPSSLDSLEALLNGAGNQDERREIIFVDAATPDYEQLLDALDTNAPGTDYQIFIIQSDRDGIEQITEILDGFEAVDAIHLLSHGNETGLQLGNSWLGQTSLDEYADAISGWSKALTEDADLLIYGCNLAANTSGQQLIGSLANLTTADVAASDDFTGARSLGGDWDLEYSLGDIASDVAISSAALDSWSNVLATFTVNTFSDTVDANPGDGLAEDASGNTSLRAAIMQANALGGSHTIELAADTYLLSIGGKSDASAATGDLDISANITITGAGASQTVIDATGVDRIFDIDTGASLTLSNMTLQGGDVLTGVTEDGGALRIQSAAVATVSDVFFSGNASARDGGAISVEGTLNMTDSVIDNNSAVRQGGGIAVGGSSAAVTLERVTVSNNLVTGSGSGGGIDIANGGFSAINLTVSGNSAGLSGDGSGGGINADRPISLTNSTITDNYALSGSGIKGGGTVTLANTIVAGNHNSADVDGAFFSSNNNLIGDVGIATGLTDGVNNDQVGSAGSPIDPLLGALADNGGPTPTHALLVGSSAIDAADPNLAPNFDQRGFLRSDGSPDIGAYEFNASPTNDGVTVSATLTDSTLEDTGLVFSVANGNEITVDDGTTGDPILRTTITVSNGTLTLATTAGLSSVTGDGTGTIVVIGSESDINNALDGLRYSPTGDYNGPADLTVTTDLQADLLGFYEFEINGDIGNDTSPNGTNDGAVVGATQIIDGTRGNVLHLDGNDVITIPGTFGDPQSLTLAAWVQLDAASGSSEVISLGNRVILRLDETFSGLGVFGSFYDGSNYLTTSSNTFIAGTGWHHVAYTIDGTTNEQTLYIDGIAVDTTNHATAVVYASGDSALGRHASSPTYFLEGEMDDARIYDRALGASEIQALAIDQFSDSETISITIDPVNDAPTAAGGTSQGWLYNEGVAALNLVDIVVSDVDSGETITATLTLADTGTGGLSANDGATYDGMTGIWTITDTVANVNTALANLEFNPNTDNDVNTTINVHIEDAAGAGPADSTIDLDVTPVPDAPTATNLTQVLPYNEGDAVVALNDIVVTEVDTGDTITAILTLADTGTGTLSANDGATYDGLTGIWTITDTVANVNTALANAVFNPGPTNDVVTTITTHIEDALGTGPVDGSITLDVTPINDAPTATNLSSTSAYNEGDASVPITDIVVSDVDAGEIITATLTLANTATGSLSANDGATYDGLTGIWTLTDTVANVNTALANLVFNPTVNNEIDTTIDVNIDDGDEDGSGALTGIIDLDVNPVNDPPVLGNNNLVVDEAATVTITPAMFSASDVDSSDPGLVFNLSAVSGGQFELTTNPGVAVFSFSQGQILLNEVVFVDDGDETAPAFSISVTDGTDSSAVVAGGVNFSNTNDAPTATNLSSTSSYNEGDPTVAITDIVVSDVDAGDLITATLTLTDTATGSLSANNGATYDGLTGVWTLTGTVAQINNALANLVFNPAVNNDIDTSIAVDIDDGDEDGGGALTGTITLDVTPINDAPTATNLSSTSNYNEGDPTVAITDIVVSDIDAGDFITATLTLADTATGSLVANDGATYDGVTGIWTITDTVANVNTALANLVFNPTVNNDVDTTVGVSIDDGDEDGSGALTGIIDLDVTPVNDAPTASNLSSTSNYDEGDASVALNDIVISDVDSGETVTATLVLANVSTGSLSANDGATYNATTGVWTITGSVAQVNTALANLEFIPVASNTLDTTVTVSIDDGDEDSSGPLLGAMTITVNPLPVVEPPVIEPPVVEPPVDEVPPDEPADEEPVEEPVADLPASAPEAPGSDPVLIPSPVAPVPSLLLDSAVEPEAQSVRDYDNDNEGDKARVAPTLKPAGVDTLISRLTEQLDFFDDPLQLIGAESFITRLNDMREELISETENTEKVIGSSLSVTAGLSVGYVVWLARSGVLLSSVLSSLPAWRFIDPLPVLGGLQSSREGDDEESLESMVEEKEVDMKDPVEPKDGNGNE